MCYATGMKEKELYQIWRLFFVNLYHWHWLAGKWRIQERYCEEDGMSITYKLFKMIQLREIGMEGQVFN